MHTLLNTIDSLFGSYGWNVHSHHEEHRTYYRKYYELERFEITYFPTSNRAKIIIPLKGTSYKVHIPEYKIYDYLYDHLNLYLKSVSIS